MPRRPNPALPLPQWISASIRVVDMTLEAAQRERAPRAVRDPLEDAATKLHEARRELER